MSSRTSKPSAAGSAGILGRAEHAAHALRRQGLLAPARRVAWAAAEAILADSDRAGAPRAPDARRCQQVVDSFAATMGAVSGTMRLGMHGLLALLELLPVVVVHRPSRMSRLPLAERIAYLQRLEEGESGLLAALLVGVKVPMCIYAFEDGEPLARTGFDRASLSSTERTPSSGASAAAPAAATPSNEVKP